MLEKWRNKSLLQKAIDDILEQMQNFSADDEEYAKMSEQLEKLHKLKMSESPKPVNFDTVVLSLSNLIGIVVIVGYEQKSVIVSKALNFMHKLR